VLSTENLITTLSGNQKKISKLKIDDKIISYNVFRDILYMDIIDTIDEVKYIPKHDTIYEATILNNLDTEYKIRFLNSILFKVDSKKWVNDERVPKKFVQSNYIKLVDNFKDEYGHQCKVLNIKEVQLKDGERFVNIIPKYNKCIYINNVLLSIFIPR